MVKQMEEILLSRQRKYQAKSSSGKDRKFLSILFHFLVVTILFTIQVQRINYVYCFQNVHQTSSSGISFISTFHRDKIISKRENMFTGKQSVFNANSNLSNKFLKASPSQTPDQSQNNISVSPAIAVEIEDKDEISLAKEEIAVETFDTVDIRSGRVLMAELIPDAAHENKPSRKYLKLLVELGFERRQIISAVRSLYDTEDILGKELMVVVNTKPEEILGLPSHGRILISNHYSKKPMPRSLRTVLQKVGLPPGSRVEIV